MEPVAPQAEPVAHNSSLGHALQAESQILLNNAVKNLGINYLPAYGIKLTDQIIINKDTQFVKIIAQPDDNFYSIDQNINNAMKYNHMIVEMPCIEEYNINPRTDTVDELFQMNEYYLHTFVAENDRHIVRELLTSLAKKLYDQRIQIEFKAGHASYFSLPKGEKSTWWNMVNPISWVGWIWTGATSFWNRLGQKAIDMQRPEYIIIYHKQSKNKFQITTTNYLFIAVVEDRNDYYYVHTNGYKFATFDQIKF